jgi:hypothetical protein
MRDNHIIDILDAMPFDSLSESELSEIQTHSKACEECGKALQAARVSAAILKFESEPLFEPSPFFQTKVMAALREQRSNARSVWDFWRLWQASGSLVSVMVLLVAGLFFATVLAPNTHGDTMAFADESEAVIFEQESALKDMTNEQMFPVILEREK